jgi:signal transduction histidine kinase
MNNAPKAIAPARRAEDMAGASAGPLGTAPVGFIVVENGGRILAVNPAAEQILGAPAEQLVGQPSSAIGPAFQDCIDEALAFGSGMSREVAGGSDSNHVLNVTTTVSKSSSGEVQCVIAEVQSAGTMRAVAGNLEQLDRLASLGVVAAGVAHEVKNALVAVRTFFDLLGAGECDPELRAVAAGEVQRIERTIRQLLRGARPTECKKSSLSVHALLQDAVNLVRHELQVRRVDLLTGFDAINDRVNGDERQLRHMVLNLLINAAESMPEGGQLNIKTDVVEAWEREHICVGITDTGTGISRENLARIFTPFFTTKPDGTGLGLAISHRIAKGHNGALQVESKPGQGTTFRILLPLL